MANTNPQPQELYTCTSCMHSIPPHLARVTCHSCPNHHLCANCQVIKAFTKPHADSHSSMVFKQSGVVVPLPPGFAPRPPPALPPRPKSTVNEDRDLGNDGVKGKGKGSEQLGAANWGALWSIMKAPLEKKGKRSRKSSVSAEEKVSGTSRKDVNESPNPITAESNSDAPLSSEEAALPPSPPKFVRRGVERVDSTAATTPSYPQPDKWEALFDEDSTPTPIFIALMSTIFARLDPEHTGFLTPETYSEFLETQGCGESNIWKNALDREGKHSKEVADLELSLYFSDLLISHTLSVRTRDTADLSDEDPQSAVEGKIHNSMRFNSNIPMISRQGFIDICAVEYLKDPTMGHKYLGKAIREYGVWKELGELPREVLPEKSIPRLLRRENETPVAEIAEKQDESCSGESKEKVMDAAKEAPVAVSNKLSNIEETQGDDAKSSKQSETQQESKTSNAPEPIKVGMQMSPIALGPPALPFQLKGGEKKIDALTKGEGFKPGEAEVRQQNGTVNTTRASAETLVGKPNVEEKGAEKSKSVESETKKPSVGDLYGAD